MKTRSLINKIVRLRFVKNYAEAHNHILIGRVLECEDTFLSIEGRTFHYKNLVFNQYSKENRFRGIEEGDLMVRIVPWSRIEVLHLLQDEVDYTAPIKFDGERIYLNNKNKTTVTKIRDQGE